MDGVKPVGGIDPAPGAIDRNDDRQRQGRVVIGRRRGQRRRDERRPGRRPRAVWPLAGLHRGDRRLRLDVRVAGVADVIAAGGPRIPGGQQARRDHREGYEDPPTMTPTVTRRLARHVDTPGTLDAVAA